MAASSLENIYDLYSKVLFAIAVEISPTKEEAEDILIATFKKIHEQNLIQQNRPLLYTTLIQILIQTAGERLKHGELMQSFKLRQFEITPLLHKLLCEKKDLESYCIENNLSRAEFGKILREEFNLLRKMERRAS